MKRSLLVRMKRSLLVSNETFTAGAQVCFQCSLLTSPSVFSVQPFNVPEGYV